MTYELDWLKKWNQYSPNSIAIQDGDSGRTYSYSQFFDAATRGASYLKSCFGISQGDRVAVLSLNELEYVVLFYALQRLGAILVPINYRLTQREVDHIVSDCRPQLIIYQPEYLQIIEGLNPEIKPPHQLPLQGPDSFQAGFTATQTPFMDFESQPESATMIIYTSGTTGAPKGAVMSQQMIFWNSINTTLRLNISQHDCSVIFLPFFHTGGWNVLTTPFFHRGARIIFLKKFDADRVLDLSDKEGATILFGVPTTMDMLARSNLFPSVKLDKVRYAIVGGEPMPIELIQTWHQRGIAIRQGYGLTEFGPNVFSLNEEDAIRKIGSIGFSNFYIETKVVDDHGQLVGPDQVGELWLKGPMCMTEYWNNPKATAETITDGWLHTGDLVRQDMDGYFYVVGRKKDMFKSGGENVYPAELEKVIRTLPGVREVAVIGVPDRKWGEVGKAFITLEPTATLTEQDLIGHCVKNLAKFKVPKFYSFIAELPKGDSGKILKRKLLDL